MKKSFTTLLVLTLVIPQLVLASWWNPFSWFDNWSFFRKEDKTQILEKRILELEKKIEESENQELLDGSKSTTTKEVATETKNNVVQVETQPKIIESKTTTNPINNTKQVKTYTLSNGTVVDEFGNILKNNSSEDTQLAQSKAYTNQQISNLFKVSVVKIETEDGSLGSGFIYDKNGNILTANHVVQGQSLVKVRLQTNEVFSGKVVWSNEYDDIAVVNIGQTGTTPVPLGNSEYNQIGDEIIVLGYPLGLDGIVLSQGILNSRQQSVNYTYLGTDANTQPGSSGGPWFNRNGEVIGLHVAGIGPKIQGIKINQGLNFAVPINYIKNKIPSNLQSYSSITPVTVSGYKHGDSISLKKSIQYAVDYNPSLGCQQLGMSGEDLVICDLYKKYKNNYTWVILDNQ